MPSRRVHTKSRLGCSQCKTRKVKVCLEILVNCAFFQFQRNTTFRGRVLSHMLCNPTVTSSFNYIDCTCDWSRRAFISQGQWEEWCLLLSIACICESFILWSFLRRCCLPLESYKFWSPAIRNCTDLG